MSVGTIQISLFESNGDLLNAIYKSIIDHILIEGRYNIYCMFRTEAKGDFFVHFLML